MILVHAPRHTQPSTAGAGGGGSTNLTQQGTWGSAGSGIGGIRKILGCAGGLWAAKHHVVGAVHPAGLATTVAQVPPRPPRRPTVRCQHLGLARAARRGGRLGGPRPPVLVLQVVLDELVKLGLVRLGPQHQQHLS